MKSSCRLVALVLVLFLSGAQAADDPAQRAELDRIRRDREQVDVQFTERERECRQRFLVTACIEDAKRDRREAMERLRQQQAAVEEVQRKQRAAQRIQDIHSKIDDVDAQRRESTARDRRREKQRAEVSSRASPEGPARAASAAASTTASNPEPSKPLTADEARKRAEYDQRIEEARAHREAVERRNAERAKAKNPAKPLPPS
jgi:colicin import membrane protein